MRFRALRRALAGAVLSSTLGHHASAQSHAEPDTGPRVEASGSELSFSLGARLERGDTRSGVLGFAALNVPLDRFARVPPSDGLAFAVPAEVAEKTPPVAADALQPASVTPSDAEEPAPLLAAPELSRLARDAVAAALRANGAALQKQDLERIASRARLSAALPELRVRGQRSDDESLRLTPSTEDPYRYSVAGGRDWLLEAQLTFRLGRLVFADEELAVERLRLERERGAARTAAHVLARLLDWHRSLSLARGSELKPEAAQKLALDALAAEVELDVLTAGWFGERAARYRESGARVAAALPPQKAPQGAE